MKGKSKIILFYFLFPWILTHGSNMVAYSQKTTNINVNIDEASWISHHDLNTFSVLNSFEFILGGINNICYNSNIGILIHSMNDLYLFDTNLNQIRTKYSNPGRREHEYISFMDFGIENNLIYILDRNSNKIIWFNPNGAFNHIDNIVNNFSSKPFCSITRINEHSYVGKRVYTGMPTEGLSLYDNQFKYICDLGSGIIRRSGITMHRNLYRSENDEILYNDYFSHEILSICPDNCYIKYIVNFGKYDIPDPSKFTDEYEIIDQINNDNELSATLISNIYESDQYLSFSCLIEEKGKGLIIYNKSSQKTSTFIVSDKDFIVLQIVPTINSIYIFMEDKDGEIYVGTFNYEQSMVPNTN